MTIKKSHHFDYPLAIIVLILLILGILILAGVSADFSIRRFEKSSYYLVHQMIWGIGIGLLGAFIVFRTPLRFFKKWAWLLILINLILMALVFIPKLGLVAGGAPRWLNLGLFSFQPAEFLKLTFIIYLSALLASKTKRKLTKDEKKQNWKYTLIPFLCILAVIITLLYFQSDASTLFLIIIIVGLVYFISENPFWHTLLLLVVGLGSLIFFIFEPYRMNRILVYLGLIKDPMKLGYQIEQAVITVGSGGIWGLGLGASSQRIAALLPQAMSDAIFAIFAQELGFIGSLALICLFLLFLWRGFIIAKNVKDRFSQLFTMGLISWICLQAFVNIGAIIEILPLTGIPLPFISYGGSHIIAELIGVGILLNISRFYKKC